MHLRVLLLGSVRLAESLMFRSRLPASRQLAQVLPRAVPSLPSLPSSPSPSSLPALPSLPSLPTLSAVASSAVSVSALRAHNSLAGTSSILRSRPTRPAQLQTTAGPPRSAYPISNLSAPVRPSTMASAFDGSKIKYDTIYRGFKPSSYALKITPDFESFKYDGEVVIEFITQEKSNSIALHSLDLEIKNASVVFNDKEVPVTDQSHSEKSQATVFTFAKEAEPGTKVLLTVPFVGTMNDHMAGFYRSVYQDKDGSKKYIFTSQLEPVDARRAFPCIDEPLFKASFQITVDVDKNLTAISNVEISKVSDLPGGKKRVLFNPTPDMSTYLVALAIGEFKYIETNQFRVPIRVYVTPDQDVEQGRYSLELAAKTLEFYEGQFGSKYPLQKMDFLAIPDFTSGAMENWGLVTYRVAGLLLDEKRATHQLRERITEVVQHELAHQWFGNLVTMEFWDGLWLNEGFATWMSWYSANHFFPDRKVWSGYVQDSLQAALSLDSLRNSHPIEVPARNSDQINQIFDDISYSKGSCVLRMVSRYLGEDQFMLGIRNYLTKHAYGNTKTSDLWAALSETTGKPVMDIMDVWTKKVGFPLLKVEEDPVTNSIKLSQTRFLYNKDPTPEENTTIYPIVLSIRTADGLDDGILFTEREKTIQLRSLDWYKINADQVGFYRTQYSTERLMKLMSRPEKSQLSEEDKIGLVLDTYALTRLGSYPTSTFYQFIKDFHQETEYHVWRAVAATLRGMPEMWRFDDPKIDSGLKKFALNLAQKKAHEVGWEYKPEDDFLQQNLKTVLFTLCTWAGDEEYRQLLQDMFVKFAAGDRDAVPNHLRDQMLDSVMTHGGEKEWEIIYNEYLSAPSNAERLSALRKVGRSPKPELIQRTLALALSDSIRGQDVHTVLEGLSTHTEGILASWEWMKANWDEIVKKLPPGLSSLGRVVRLCVRSLGLPEHVADVREFFANKDVSSFNESLAQSLENIEAKMAWSARDRKDVEAWLQSNYLW